MTHEDFCDQLRGWGYKEFKPPPGAENVLNFAPPERLDATLCDCNDKPPPFHVSAHRDVHVSGVFHVGGVDVRSFGEKDGRWISFTIYTFQREEVTLELLEELQGRVVRIWEAFCA